MRFMSWKSRVLFILLCVISFYSCKKSDTYADYVEMENEAIDSYLSSNKIKVVSEMPQGKGEWMDGDRKVFYLYEIGKSDGLYYHQVELGDGDQIPQANWTAYVRYKGYTLNGELLYDCTSSRNPDPLSFVIAEDALNQTYARGFQQAVKNLRVGGHCQVIIPFDIGNGDLKTVSGSVRSDSRTKQPMFYDIWLVGLE